jgi:hypothetical protein
MSRIDFDETYLHSTLGYFIGGLMKLNMYSFCLAILPVVFVGLIACVIAIIFDFVWSARACFFR